MYIINTKILRIFCFVLFEGGTNGTGNNTMRYDQLMEDENDEGEENEYQIPTQLSLIVEPSGANETVPFSLQPKLWMRDEENNMVNNVGFGETGAWVVTATIRSATGDPNATIIGNNTAKFSKGWANFTTLSISHNGTGYILDFHISKPDTANFQTSSQPFDVKERVLYFSVSQQPSNGNETAPLSRQPQVDVRDVANGEIVNNTGWKGRKWYATASLIDPNNNGAQLNGTKTIEFMQGMASFTDLSIDVAGQNYRLTIDTKTEPTSRYSSSVNTASFDVEDRVLHLVVVRQPGDCNDTVACGVQPIIEVRDSNDNTLAGNLGWRGRKWYASVTTTNGNTLVGQTRMEIPPSGQLTFTDIGLNDVGSGIILQFNLETDPASSYDSLTAKSGEVEVKEREFYLAIAEEIGPELALPFSMVVEVRDVGTGMKGIPLKTSLSLTVTLVTNPTAANFTGTHTVTVTDAVGNFTDLMIDKLGTGFEVEITSTKGHKVRQ